MILLYLREREGECEYFLENIIGKNLCELYNCYALLNAESSSHLFYWWSYNNYFIFRNIILFEFIIMSWHKMGSAVWFIFNYTKVRLPYLNKSRNWSSAWPKLNAICCFWAFYSSWDLLAANNIFNAHQIGVQMATIMTSVHVPGFRELYVEMQRGEHKPECAISNAGTLRVLLTRVPLWGQLSHS